jgi:hypothetical protein
MLYLQDSGGESINLCPLEDVLIQSGFHTPAGLMLTGSFAQDSMFKFMIHLQVTAVINCFGFLRPMRRLIRKGGFIYDVSVYGEQSHDPPKHRYILIPKPCEYVALWGRTDLLVTMKFRFLR